MSIAKHRLNAVNVAVNDGSACLTNVKPHLNASSLSLNDVATKRTSTTFSGLEHARVWNASKLSHVFKHVSCIRLFTCFPCMRFRVVHRTPVEAVVHRTPLALCHSIYQEPSLIDTCMDLQDAKGNDISVGSKTAYINAYSTHRCLNTSLPPIVRFLSC